MSGKKERREVPDHRQERSCSRQDLPGQEPGRARLLRELRQRTGRQRRNFANLDLAKREANNVAQHLADGDMEALKLTGREKQIYVEAERAIAGTGLPLHSVAHEFARAFDILGGANIVEAARYYKKHVDVDLPQITVADAVEKFRAAKEAEGMSAMYLKDIRGLLGDFAKDFQCPLSSIQPEDLREYLNAKRVGLVSKENRRRMLVVLFNFAKAQGWLRANQETAADALGTYKIKQREVEIYTPAEIARLLNAADADFLPYLALDRFRRCAPGRTAQGTFMGRDQL